MSSKKFPDFTCSKTKVKQTKKTTQVIDEFTIDFDESNKTTNRLTFPFEFRIKFKSRNGQLVSVAFTKLEKDSTTYPISSSKIFILDKADKKPTEFQTGSYYFEEVILYTIFLIKFVLFLNLKNFDLRNGNCIKEWKETVWPL